MQQRTIHRSQTSHNRQADKKSQPFVEHLNELRRRLYYVAIAVVGFAVGIYFIQQRVVNMLLKPAHGQHFIYTTPGGGLDFLFRICIYGGIILSTPVIVYNLLKFFEPIMSRDSHRFVTFISIICSILAFAGLVFGYYFGLPAALNFLLHQFTTAQIRPLVTIQSYLSFVVTYMLGSALLFQFPIILIVINRIKPIKPSTLFRYERWVILIAFVLSGLMNPTPNMLSQLIIAGPFIIMYQISIGLIALINRDQNYGNEPLTNEAPAQYQSQAYTELNVQPQPEIAVATVTSQPPVMRGRFIDIIPQNHRRPTMPLTPKA